MIETLGPLRHACNRCGASCQGHVVGLTDADVPKVVAAAEALGVADPVADGALRRDAQGRCVFLADDNLCRIHTEVGVDDKPTSCRQFPFVALRLEDGTLRVGLDPGCLSTWSTWRDADELEPDTLVATRLPLDSEARRIEEALLDVCSIEGQTLQGVTDALCKKGWDRRLAREARRSKLPALFDRLAPVLRGPLVPVGQRLKTLHRAPMTRLGAESDALAVETVRRMVHLRLLPTVDNPVEAALYTLFGVWLCAWTSIEPSRFGPAAAAWCRAIRADEVREQLGNVATIARG